MVDPLQGEGDHVLPALLGEFEGDIRFRRICRTCNTKIGQSEQQLLRCSPASFFRAIVRPALPRGRRRGGSSMGSAMGMAAPTPMIEQPDHMEIVDFYDNDPRQIRQIDQFVVHDSAGKEFHIRLFPTIKLEHLKKRLARLGVSKIEKLWLHCDEQRWDTYISLATQLLPKPQIQLLPTASGVHQVQGVTKISYNFHTFRAIAKIAFHYYLTRSPRGPRGDEPEFSEIRKFIMEGTSGEQFFNQPSPQFRLPFGELPTGGFLTSSRWCHVLAVHDGPPDLVVCVRLFVGPGFDPQPYYVHLGRLASPILMPNPGWGHVYLYADPQPQIGIAGTVKQLEMIPYY
jgi:hypothetical protein